MSLEIGQIIDAKYRIVRLIGEGGMGAVYEGENTLIRRRVAIKILLASSASNAEAISRFEREAQAAGQIGSDHILEVLDLGALPNGDRYMVMEYLDGETFTSRIAGYGKMPARDVAPLARQFLSGLAAAHAAGIIHRDLKPDNIFILREKAGRPDFVKLIDFGISKFLQTASDPGMKMTRVGAMMGTPCYMSPEQARGSSEADARTDIYACGVILYEAVTGQVPFDGNSFNDLMFKIALSEPIHPTVHAPSLDSSFAAIIMKAMSREPTERYQTVDEFARALDVWMRENELTSTIADRPNALGASNAFPMPKNSGQPTLPLSALAPQPPRSSLTTPTDEKPWARSHSDAPQKRRGKMIFGVVAALVGVLVIGGIAFSKRAKGTATAAANNNTEIATTAAPAKPKNDIPPVVVAPSAIAPVGTAASTADAGTPSTQVAAVAMPAATPVATPVATTTAASPPSKAAKAIVSAAHTSSHSAGSSPQTKSNKTSKPTAAPDFGY